MWFNSVVPLSFGSNFKNVISKDMLWIRFMSMFCKVVPRWMPQNTFDDKSTLAQIMAWCHQAPSHYLSQCWPRSMLPYGVTRPQWVNYLLACWFIAANAIPSCVWINIMAFDDVKQLMNAMKNNEKCEPSSYGCSSLGDTGASIAASLTHF